MNIKRLTRKKRVKDDWAVVPSSSLIKRLVSSLENSHDIIKRYFPNNAVENGYLTDLEDMLNYFSDYK